MDESSPPDRPRLRYEKREHVAYVTIDRPEVLNALDRRTHAQLAEVWDDFEKDDDLWVGVLSGAGGRAFSVGQDLKELASRNAEGAAPSTYGSRGAPGWPRLTERLDFAKPLVAKVDGYALGGGFELALACDVIVASTRSVFGLPEARLGLVPGAGGVFRLVRQLPYRTAMGLLLTGRRIDAARALGLGLINDVVPEDELDGCVQRWVTDILSCAPLSTRSIKEAARRSVDMPLAGAFEADFKWEARRLRSADTTEGPRAFVEKREPRWTGR